LLCETEEFSGDVDGLEFCYKIDHGRTSDVQANKLSIFVLAAFFEWKAKIE